MKRGAIPVPTSTLLTAEEVLYLARDSGAVAMVTDAESWAAMHGALEAVASVAHVLVVGDCKVPPPERIRLTDGAVLDIDLSYGPEHIGLMLDRITKTGARMVLASPYMRVGRVVDDAGGQLGEIAGERRIGTVAHQVRIFVRQILPSLGLPRLAPRALTRGAFAPPDHRMPLVARDGGGVYLAYCSGYPVCTQVLLWRIGGGPRLIAKGPNIQDVNLARGPDGRLWVMWQDGTRRQLYATRTNKPASKVVSTTGDPSRARRTATHEPARAGRAALGEGAGWAITPCRHRRRGSSTSRTVGSAGIPRGTPPTPLGGRGQ